MILLSFTNLKESVDFLFISTQTLFETVSSAPQKHKIQSYTTAPLPPEEAEYVAPRQVIQ